MPLFLAEKRADLEKVKVLAFESNFPKPTDVEAKKEKLKLVGQYSYLSWRKFLISNNTYMMNY